jgi:hypothetical protein
MILEACGRRNGIPNVVRVASIGVEAACAGKITLVYDAIRSNEV